jgi:hypothetical protein
MEKHAFSKYFVEIQRSPKKKSMTHTVLSVPVVKTILCFFLFVGNATSLEKAKFFERMNTH